MDVSISGIVLRKAFRLHNLLLIGFIFCLVYVIGSDSFAKEKTRPWTKIQIFADNGFEPKIAGLRVEGGIAKDDIIKRFGKPLKDSSTKTKGADPDEILTWEYKGLTIVLYRPVDSEPNYYWISKIILISPDYSLKYGLKIGETKSVFLKELGNPDKEIDKLLIYNANNYASISEHVSFAGHIQVSIEFDKQDKARKIIWEYGWD